MPPFIILLVIMAIVAIAMAYGLTYLLSKYLGFDMLVKDEYGRNSPTRTANLLVVVLSVLIFILFFTLIGQMGG